MIGPTWVMGDSTEIPLGSMSTAHIQNCIIAIQNGVIKRWGCDNFRTSEWLLIFQTELRKRSRAIA